MPHEEQPLDAASSIGTPFPPYRFGQIDIACHDIRDDVSATGRGMLSKSFGFARNPATECMTRLTDAAKTI